MSAAQLGRRYERLLVASAPLSLAALIILFVAHASTTQEDRVTSSCFEAGAATLQENRPALDIRWDQDQDQEKKTRTKSEWYRSKHFEVLSQTLIYARPLRNLKNCYEILSAEIKSDFRLRSSEILEKWKARAVSLTRAPLSLYGIEVPDQADMNLFGIHIKISLMTLSRVLQVILAPLLILWLGSLYNTRYRETFLIHDAKVISEIFPHLINVYPSMTMPTLRKRNFLAPAFPHVIAIVSAFVRICLLSVFVLPPVVAYLAGLYLLSAEEFRTLFWAMGLIVFSFTFVLIFAEMLPWHFYKRFPAPPVSVWSRPST